MRFMLLHRLNIVQNLRAVYPVPQRLKYIGSGIFGGLLFYSIFSKQIKSAKEELSIMSVLTAKTEDDSSKNKKRTLMYNFIADAVEEVAPSVVYIEVPTRNFSSQKQIASSASGFVVREDGLVLTSAHVVNNAVNVDVEFSNGSKYKGYVIDADYETDLAAIKLKNDSDTKFPYVRLGKSSNVRPGEWVAALGSPLRLSNTVTCGIVSHRLGSDLGLSRKDMIYIQTDAAINTGNSGGPLINLDGEVIGINCITVQGASGISFAVPSDYVSAFLEGAIEKEKTFHEGKFAERYARGEKFFIGVSMLTLNPSILRELQFRNPGDFNDIQGGVLVARVNPRSPADRCGLISGDVIIAVNDISVKSSRDISNEVHKGESMTLKVQRGQHVRTLIVKPEIVSRL